MSIVALAIFLLGGCAEQGSSASPPDLFRATPGDGRVIVEWTPNPSVEYWLFTATDPSLTAFHFLGLPNAYIYTRAATPFYMCGLFDGTTYYFAANGRIDGGPGGSSSPTINETPYNASAIAWTAPAVPANGVPSSTDLYGVGYTSLTTCGNIPISATGSFAAVGAGGAIFTSADGITWFPQVSPVATDLYAVTGYAAYQNNPGNPGLRWVAVGAGGASVYSQDGITWAEGNPPNSNSLANPSNNALRSITQVSGIFFAVGDTGTILSSSDGITWTSHTATSNTTNNLRGVTHGAIFVAVGDSGTIVTSVDGNTWTVRTPSAAVGNLKQVTTFGSVYGSIYVAVGDAGAVVTSIDGGITWITQTALTGSPNLVGITAEYRAMDPATAVKDPSLNFISVFQLVAVDSSGNVYTSQNGYDWSGPFSTGITLSNLNVGQPLVSSGFGYVAAGNSGATAYAF
jgi:hypothetical protein